MVKEKIMPSDQSFKNAAEFIITTYKTWQEELKSGRTTLQLWQWMKLYYKNRRWIGEFDFTRPKPPKNEEGENYRNQPEPAGNYFQRIIEKAKKQKTHKED